MNEKPVSRASVVNLRSVFHWLRRHPLLAGLVLACGVLLVLVAPVGGAGGYTSSTLLGFTDPGRYLLVPNASRPATVAPSVALSEVTGDEMKRRVAAAVKGQVAFSAELDEVSHLVITGEGSTPQQAEEVARAVVVEYEALKQGELNEAAAAGLKDADQRASRYRDQWEGMPSATTAEVDQRRLVSQLYLSARRDAQAFRDLAEAGPGIVRLGPIQEAESAPGLGLVRSVVLGLLLGGVLAFGAGFVGAIADRSIRTRAELEELTPGSHVLGAVAAPGSGPWAAPTESMAAQALARVGVGSLVLIPVSEPDAALRAQLERMVDATGHGEVVSLGPAMTGGGASDLAGAISTTGGHVLVVAAGRDGAAGVAAARSILEGWPELGILLANVDRVSLPLGAISGRPPIAGASAGHHPSS